MNQKNFSDKNGRKILIFLSLIAVVMLALYFASYFPLTKPNQTNELNPSRRSSVQIPNPAAVYCVELGYEYQIRNGPKGQYGVCIFSDETECDGWSFFKGKCGQKYTYCEKIAGGTIVTTNKGCIYNSDCAVCILPDGTKYYEFDLFAEKVYKGK